MGTWKTKWIYHSNEWFILTFQKIINYGNHLFNLFIKTKIPQSKEQYYNEYKIYRNSIVNLIRISRSNHYKIFLISTLIILWKGINELINLCNKNFVSNITLNIYNNTETDPSITSNIFNNFFTTIADKIRYLKLINILINFLKIALIILSFLTLFLNMKF